MSPDLTLFVRFGALAFAVLAMTLAGLQLLQPPAPVAAPPAPSPAKPVDPLRAELTRCQALGEAGAGDAACLAAWGESRRRFLGPPAGARGR